MGRLGKFLLNYSDSIIAAALNPEIFSRYKFVSEIHYSKIFSFLEIILLILSYSEIDLFTFHFF